jgi:drug/metabolite transporter (DMT)-like permease
MSFPMEIILVLFIINAALGSQKLFNKHARSNADQGVDTSKPSSGLQEFGTATALTWWRELFKLAWTVVAVVIEACKGHPARYFWPGLASVVTVSICSFTGVIENVGFYTISRYSPHLWVPYINFYLVALPIFTGIMFGSTVRKEHWIGTCLVILGLFLNSYRFDGFDGALESLGQVIMASAKDSHYEASIAAKLNALDLQAYIWIIVINCCLCSQQVLNNKSVQLATHKVSANAFVLWREIFKFIYASMFLVIVAFITGKTILHYLYFGQEFTSFNNTAIIFALAAGLTGYIYSWGFFKLSKYPVHIWVPFTTLYVVAMPFLSVAFVAGAKVTLAQLIGATICGAGLFVGLSDYKRNKIEKITEKQN